MHVLVACASGQQPGSIAVLKRKPMCLSAPLAPCVHGHYKQHTQLVPCATHIHPLLHQNTPHQKPKRHVLLSLARSLGGFCCTYNHLEVSVAPVTDGWSFGSAPGLCV